MNSFIIDVLETRNQTWQGTVTWVGSDEKKKFRSVLELVSLIDSVVGEDRPEFEVHSQPDDDQ
ncbi:MAG: hypothetical protein DUD26_06685 [Eubacteriaceae bacterium]|jgi:hypothetical protein|uniref:Uncharacterized protein n=1 Tax=Candidatus Pseudoramibacter fermentans TaxID=2594427 RepID=A0A6L5GPG9_9FIRM|nr:hypothetical protein [Candidatus Pseudoramibacter fermentans]RRF92451.1 MAG: hypothetical protein DUD26_06685 [Eubacteriaceae bacterium]